MESCSVLIPADDTYEIQLNVDDASAPTVTAKNGSYRKSEGHRNESRNGCGAAEAVCS